VRDLQCPFIAQPPIITTWSSAGSQSQSLQGQRSFQHDSFINLPQYYCDEYFIEEIFDATQIFIHDLYTTPDLLVVKDEYPYDVFYSKI
jgi:hypothetical protein